MVDLGKNKNTAHINLDITINENAVIALMMIDRVFIVSAELQPFQSLQKQYMFLSSIGAQGSSCLAAVQYPCLCTVGNFSRCPVL